MKTQITKGAGACALTAMLLPAMTLAQDSAVVVERDSSKTVRAGERYEYEVKITNQAEVPVKSVKMTEFVSDKEMQDEAGSVSIPLLKAGESKKMTISGIARKEGQFQSCLAVDYSPAVCTDVNVVKPDLSLECDMASPEQSPKSKKGADMAVLYACEPVQLTCKVSNEGSGKTRQAQLMLDAPKGLEFEEGKARRKVDSIAAGEQQEFSYRLTAQQAGEYKLTPRLKTETGMAEARPINFRIVQPELELALQSPDQEFISRSVSYTVHLRNTGEVPVPNTRLSVEAPDTLENLSISSEANENGDGEREFGTLKPGESRMVSIQGDAVEPGKATLSVSATGYCVEDKQRTAEVAIKGVPALVLRVIDKVDPVVVGGETTYDVTVKNQGTASADNIKISGTLGDQFRFVDGEGDSEVSGDRTKFDFAAIKNLEAGQSISWTVTAKAREAGYARLNLELQSTATKRLISAQEPTRVIE